MADTLSALKIPKATAFLSGANAPVTPKGYVGMRELAPIQEELATAESQAQKDVGMADINIEKAKREETTRDLESQSKFVKEEADKLRDLPERQAMKEKRKEFGDFKFVPTKENTQDLATLFSLVSVIGMAIGGGGKQNAQQAMSAMNGMLEGHQKGRADLYKQQQVEFDKNFKAMQAAVQSAEKEYEEAVKMHMVDKEAGEMARKMALAKMHSPMLKAMEDRLGPLAVLNTLKELKTSVKNATELENKLQSQADKRQDAKDAKEAAERRHREDAAQRERLAKIRAEGSGKTSALLAGRAENIREAFAQASADIVNITKFPKGTMLGSFAGLTGASADSMVGAIRNGIARGVTEKEQRMLEALLSGIEGHMAFALGGGYATSQSKARMDQYKAQLARAGDDPAQVPLMLARFRQEMNILAENFPSKPGATPEMNKAVQKYNDAINNAVPFTVDNVLDAELGTGKKDAGKGSSVDEERSRAKAAIAAGKDPDAVKARFKTKTGQEL
jgi:hypothetical protein